MIFTIVIFVVVLGLLVFVHELGHFLVAKRGGMKVDEFGFGFPPRLVGVQKSDSGWRVVWGNKDPLDTRTTVYSLNWIPLGGFVKIVGENNEEGENPQSFINKPFFVRLATLLAGVTMNLITAWALISIGFMFGLPVAVDGAADVPAHARVKQQQVLISDVQKDSPAEAAGFKPGDLIVSIDGQSTEAIGFVQQYILNHKGQEIHVQVKRINEIKDLSVTPRVEVKEGEGPTGVGLLNSITISYPWYYAFIEGAQTTLYQLSNIVTGLYSLFTSGNGFKSLGGPVKIAQLTGQVAELGLVRLMQFAAFLSLNLAILNVIPFPALDGGRVLFLIIEKIRGKRNNQNVEQIANAVGFFALLTLMLLVTIKDVGDLGGVGHIISRLIHG